MISTVSAAFALLKSQDTGCALIKQCPVIEPRPRMKCVVINPFNIIRDHRRKEQRLHQRNHLTHKETEQISATAEVINISNPTKQYI